MLFKKTKTIIIVGSSRFGSGLAGMLSQRGSRVVVIDVKEDAFRKLPDGFSGYEMIGDGTDMDVLKQAGIEEASIVIAATDDDNTNLLIAQIASRIFHVSNVYSRLNDKNKEKLIRGFNIQPICPFVLSVNEFARLSNEEYREVSSL